MTPTKIGYVMLPKTFDLIALFSSKCVMIFARIGLRLPVASPASITKVDDDTYTFSVDTDTATTGNLKGGGKNASAGPVTISP